MGVREVVRWPQARIGTGLRPLMWLEPLATGGAFAAQSAVKGSTGFRSICPPCRMILQTIFRIGSATRPLKRSPRAPWVPSKGTDLGHQQQIL